MDPKLLEYMRILSGQPMAGGNPIAEGTQSGIQAARSSMGMDAAQAARSRGMAFMTMGNHLAQPGHGPGFGGALKAFNTGFLPAAKAYRGEEQQAEAQNAHIMEQARLHQMKNMEMAHRIRESEIQAQQRKEEQEKLAQYRQDELAERRRSSNLSRDLAERKLAQKEAFLDPSLQKEGFIHLPSQNKKFQDKFGETAIKHTESIPENKRVKATLDKMKTIMDENKNLGDSLGHLIINDDEASLKNLLARRVYDKKELAAIEKMRKLSNALNLSTIKGSTAKMATDLFKNMVRNASASGRLTNEGFNFIYDDMNEIIDQNLKTAHTYQNALKTGYFPMDEFQENDKKEAEAPMVQEIQALQGKHPGAILMRDPKGKLRPIDPSKVEEARQLGAIEVGK